MTERASPGHAVVLLSGGLDSATTLSIARADGYRCHTLAVDYGQRHRAELNAAQALSTQHNAKTHRVVKVDLRSIGGSALTDDIEVPTEASEGIPVTYVPARNTLMLSLALGLAETLAARTVFIGVNAVDYSGYPDCRPQFIAAFEDLSRLATKVGVEGQAIRIRTPLIHLTKADIIRTGIELGLDYSQTVSCYQATAEGLACGQCDSCRIRREGFEQAGIADPTRYATD
ncbi:MAG: 7-cyano-7-deazaguanine synthase QueC [Pseudomonadota bacterium]